MKFTLKRSRRAKYMRLRVVPGGAIVLTAPQSESMRTIERFLSSHMRWIERAVARMSRFKPLPAHGRRSYLKHKEEARAFVTERVEFWNRVYKHSYGRIAIKNTKRTWGSCSRKGNLNFSYALLFLPRELADYVVIHELCHLREHNHGPRFWARLAEACPDYRRRRAELRRYLPQA